MAELESQKGKIKDLASGMKNSGGGTENFRQNVFEWRKRDSSQMIHISLRMKDYHLEMAKRW